MIVMRTDLGMKTGKMIAQAGHAIVGVFHYNCEPDHQTMKLNWFESGMKKVCVAADSEAVLNQCVAKAKELNVPYYLVNDAGLTQVPEGAATCAAFGPGKDKVMEKITGSLKLLGGDLEEEPARSDVGPTYDQNDAD